MMKTATSLVVLMGLLGVGLVALSGCSDKKKSGDPAPNANANTEVDPLLKDLPEKEQKNLMKLSAEDRKLAFAQKTCPKGKGAIGAMGKPIKVEATKGKFKGQFVFVCCDGCVDAVKDDPDTYFAKAMKPRL